MMSSVCWSPKGGKGNRLYMTEKKHDEKIKSVFFWTQVSTALLPSDEHGLESSCSGLISRLWYVRTRRTHVCQSPFSLCVNQRLEGTTSFPTPNSAPASPRVPVGSNKEGGQGKGQAWSSIGERRQHRRQSRRQMDQQMVSFRRIPEDDRAAGHMQRESGRDRQRNRDGLRQREERGGLRFKSFSLSFSLVAPPHTPS